MHKVEPNLPNEDLKRPARPMLPRTTCWLDLLFCFSNMSQHRNDERHLAAYYNLRDTQTDLHGFCSIWTPTPEQYQSLRTERSHIAIIPQRPAPSPGGKLLNRNGLPKFRLSGANMIEDSKVFPVHRNSKREADAALEA